MNKYLVINQQNITQIDLKILLYFYQPIIKDKGFLLFHYFLSIKNSYVNFEYLNRIFQINKTEFEKYKKIFMVLGLIKTLYNKREAQYIIQIEKPLSIAQIKKNPYIYNLISDNITKPLLEDLINNIESQEIDLSAYEELSENFFEIFSPENLQQDNDDSENIDFNNLSHKEAKQKLNSIQYYRFLTNSDPRPRLKNLFVKFKNLGFSQAGINHTLEFCHKVNKNGKQFNIKYFSKILDDFYKDNIITSNEVLLELENTYRYKNINQNVLEIDSSYNSSVKKIIFKTNNDNDSDKEDNDKFTGSLFQGINDGEGWV
ncbi:Chromosome replication initiation and membrane attachment protein [Mesomycoplasma conjunctivae]|uniref:Replicative helicase loading/DNA remodeling protein DnaB N-terminal winged helix domain-containing protein n=1 Tax=Mesomycoplasma conjunctivae (strain ATCC 25834 / NCTC 10147 / HRC/581) TaxID=572263 RepID=C5J730_MESCH|nr:hypothetical protein [Mesomycoplasma conjunctivae]CAT05293.1 HYPOTHETICAL PROTEIN MCJ_005960 [Mesomycoplasma conjunctivae]VEU66522.1 Chromosome replication initiation and membrane attachment protein [Mesomycoplasma conjunctivae]